MRIQKIGEVHCGKRCNKGGNKIVVGSDTLVFLCVGDRSSASRSRCLWTIRVGIGAGICAGLVRCGDPQQHDYVNEYGDWHYPDSNY